MHCSGYTIIQTCILISLVASYHSYPFSENLHCDEVHNNTQKKTTFKTSECSTLSKGLFEIALNLFLYWHKFNAHWQNSKIT